MSSFDEVWERIKDVTSLKTLSDLADAVGVKQSGVSKVKKRNAFRAEWVFVLAEKHGFSSDWAWTGKGQPHGIENIEDAPTQPIDLERMQAMIEVIEEKFEKDGKYRSPEKKAKIIITAYTIYVNSGEEVDKKTIDRLLDLAA